MIYRVPDHVNFRSLHDEVVLLDSKNDSYLGLNRTAAVTWEVIAAGGSREQAVAVLVDRFNVSAESAQVDTGALIDDLVARGLLEVVP